MKLTTQPDYKKSNSKSLKATTKTFEGSNSFEEAENYSKQTGSYVFTVMIDKRTETGRIEKVFYGYGVPK